MTIGRQGGAKWGRVCMTSTDPCTALEQVHVFVLLAVLLPQLVQVHVEPHCRPRERVSACARVTR